MYSLIRSIYNYMREDEGGFTADSCHLCKKKEAEVAVAAWSKRTICSGLEEH